VVLTPVAPPNIPPCGPLDASLVHELLVQGPEPHLRSKVRLDPPRPLVLGRSLEADVPVPWELHLSRQHARLTMLGSSLRVEQLPGARNPMFVGGYPREEFTLRCGEQFVVGQTAFHFVEAAVEPTPESFRPLEEYTFTRQQLQQVQFGDADRRIEMLSRLPEVIAGASDLEDLGGRLVRLVLSGIRAADAVAIVELDAQGRATLGPWERRFETAGAFRPSARLVTDALDRQRGTVVHVWSGSESVPNDYTQSAEVDWAFCTPMANRQGQRWGIYVSGRLSAAGGGGGAGLAGPELQADVKFTELVAEIIDSVLRMRNLEGSLAVLRQFLAPPIIAALERTSTNGGLDVSLLEPRECAVTVLFCDLRGFSQRAESAAHDLAGLLERVSGALAIMTRQITAWGGVTGDFLGDATLGFWGWPFASEEAPLNACRAALAIRREFESLRDDPRHPLADFEVGIGIAHGRAMAGKIGTQERVTVSVFGPVVNLASRLEGLTRQLHVPILLDEAMGEIVRQRMSESEGRTRRLARIQPFGLETPLTVSELLPPEREFPELTTAHLRRYEEGLDHFLAGRWDEAYRCLHDIPPSDRAQDFLTLRIAQHHRTAPPGWDGVIRIPGK
jgi:adenylate cyclase